MHAKEVCRRRAGCQCGCFDLTGRSQALDLGTKKDDRLDPIAEELRDLKGVWTALSGLLGQVDQLRETLWSTIQVSSFKF